MAMHILDLTFHIHDIGRALLILHEGANQAPYDADSKEQICLPDHENA
jgi:hypothetical protein